MSLPISAEKAHMCRLYSEISRKLSFEDIAVLLFGDCLHVYWLEFTIIRRLKIIRGTRQGKAKETSKNP
jgi:hypothetical protein